MPYKDASKRLAYARAYNAANRERLIIKKQEYYYANRGSYSSQ